MNHVAIMNNHQFEIWQWNIRGLKQNENELADLIEEHKLEIIITLETFFSSESKVKFKNYVILRKARNSYGGEVLIAIDKNTPFTDINIIIF